MKPESDLVLGQLRLLETDNPLIIPTNTLIRLLVTGMDVIHSWTVPAFGVKTDAIPGRLNQSWLVVEKEGTYYGQCSELCGVNHAFMPIQVKTTNSSFFFDVNIFDMAQKFSTTKLSDWLFNDPIISTYMQTFETGLPSSGLNVDLDQSAINEIVQLGKYNEIVSNATYYSVDESFDLVLNLIIELSAVHGFNLAEFEIYALFKEASSGTINATSLTIADREILFERHACSYEGFLHLLYLFEWEDEVRYEQSLMNGWSTLGAPSPMNELPKLDRVSELLLGANIYSLDESFELITDLINNLAAHDFQLQSHEVYQLLDELFTRGIPDATNWTIADRELFIEKYPFSYEGYLHLLYLFEWEQDVDLAQTLLDRSIKISSGEYSYADILNLDELDRHLLATDTYELDESVDLVIELIDNLSAHGFDLKSHEIYGLYLEIIYRGIPITTNWTIAEMDALINRYPFSYAAWMDLLLLLEWEQEVLYEQSLMNGWSTLGAPSR